MPVTFVLFFSLVYCTLGTLRTEAILAQLFPTNGYHRNNFHGFWHLLSSRIKGQWAGFPDHIRLQYRTDSNIWNDVNHISVASVIWEHLLKLVELSPRPLRQECCGMCFDICWKDLNIFQNYVYVAVCHIEWFCAVECAWEPGFRSPFSAWVAHKFVIRWIPYILNYFNVVPYNIYIYYKTAGESYHPTAGSEPFSSSAENAPWMTGVEFEIHLTCHWSSWPCNWHCL